MSDKRSFKKRLFLGIPLNERQRREIRVLQQYCALDYRWTTLDNLHMTLYFLGDTSVQDEKRIHQGLAQLIYPCFSLELQAPSFFRRPAGIAGILHLPVKKKGELEKLYRDIAEILKVPREGNEKLFPHITLGRTKTVKVSELKEFFISHPDWRVSESFWQINSFHLYQSLLSPSGPSYQILASYSCSRESK